jgi:hypothetical protein
MNNQPDQKLMTSREQIVYANMLLIGVWFGLFFLLFTYTIYLSGIFPHHVPISEVTKYWSVGVDEYLEATGSPHGWQWLSLLNRGDFLNYAGFAFLGSVSLLCFGVLLWGYLQKRDLLYSLICALEIAVLALAASGLLGVGGH